MRASVFICLVVFALAITVNSLDLRVRTRKVQGMGPVKVSGSNSFDFYVFVLQWDPKMNTDYFTIHGLWPENADGTYPANCPGPKFNTTAIKDIISLLNDVWPSNKGDNAEFWTHEWEKHGTCSLMGEHAYFQNSIELHDKYDVKAALAKSRIVPKQKATYSKASVSSAVNTNIGALPALKCDGDALLEIALCISKSLALMDCPTTLGSYFTCPTNVTYD